MKNSNIKHTVSFANPKDATRYLSENVKRIESITVMNEAVKVTPEVIDEAWRKVKRMFRKDGNKTVVSEQALQSVADNIARDVDPFDTEIRGSDDEAFYKVFNALVDRCVQFNVEVLSKDEYNSRFHLDPGPQSDLEKRMIKREERKAKEDANKAERVARWKKMAADAERRAEMEMPLEESYKQIIRNTINELQKLI